MRQARRKQIKSEGAKFLISKWKYLFFSKFQSESKKNTSKKGGGVLTWLILSFFGIFNAQDFHLGCTREESMYLGRKGSGVLPQNFF